MYNAASLKPKRKKRAPVHPGEILREDFLMPMRLNANAVDAP
jgi:plasmid maintenance system antidote protein VapI